MKGPAMSKRVNAPTTAGARARARPSAAWTSTSALMPHQPAWSCKGLGTNLQPTRLLDRPALGRAIAIVIQQFLAFGALQELYKLLGQRGLFAVLKDRCVEHQRLSVQRGLLAAGQRDAELHVLVPRGFHLGVAQIDFIGKLDERQVVRARRAQIARRGVDLSGFQTRQQRGLGENLLRILIAAQDLVSQSGLLVEVLRQQHCEDDVLPLRICGWVGAPEAQTGGLQYVIPRLLALC